MSTDAIIVGLGNPGKEYEKTRHNVGFMAVSRFAAAHNLRFSSKGVNNVMRQAFIGCCIQLEIPVPIVNKQCNDIAFALFYFAPQIGDAIFLGGYT